MTTEKKYRNDHGAEITDSKATAIGDFYIETTVDGVVKTEESYSNNILFSFIYYMDSNENLTDLVAQYSLKPHTVGFRREIQSQNRYKVFEHLGYQQGQLDGKLITVEDSNGKIICTQWIDINSDTPTHSEKSYYDQNGIESYQFKYDNNGALYSISDQEETYGGLYTGASIAELNFEWTGLEYYQAGEPLIPGIIT
jgi:hypothetical protein